jgi:hypothetical protein
MVMVAAVLLGSAKAMSSDRRPGNGLEDDPCKALPQLAMIGTKQPALAAKDDSIQYLKYHRSKE